ncbi:MAG: ABC transporter permease [Bacteroidales bacterium]|jgi:ABC-2 type transport system permease protein
MTFNAFKRVWKRELKMMFSRPIYLFSTVFVLAFCYIFFLTFLREGMPEKLPIAVVDLDQSVISRRFYREINATASTEVVMRCTSYQEARDQMQRGNIHGFIVIPDNLYKDLLANKRPEVSFYVNNSYLISGTLSYKDMMTMSALASGAYQREFLRARGVPENLIMGRIQPIVIDSHLIGNPWANYGIYLINVLLPGVLQLIVLLMTVYAIGVELKNRSSLDWLETADGSLAFALAGKLAPYTILFSILGIAGNVLLYKFVNFPFHGSFAFLCVATILFVIAHQAVGIFMIGLFPVLRDGISFAALYGILSFTYAGFTFPIEAMPPLAQGASVLFPIRHYFMIYVNEALLGADIGKSLIYAGALISFLILPFLVYYRLKKALINQHYPVK